MKTTSLFLITLFSIALFYSHSVLAEKLGIREVPRFAFDDVVEYNIQIISEGYHGKTISDYAFSIKRKAVFKNITRLTVDISKGLTKQELNIARANPPIRTSEENEHPLVGGGFTVELAGDYSERRITGVHGKNLPPGYNVHIAQHDDLIKTIIRFLFFQMPEKQNISTENKWVSKENYLGAERIFINQVRLDEKRQLIVSSNAVSFPDIDIPGEEEKVLREIVIDRTSGIIIFHKYEDTVKLTNQNLTLNNMIIVKLANYDKKH